jgi:VanZ family protein
LKASRAAILLGPPLALHALIYWLSSQERLPAAPRGSDKAAHFIAYAILTLAWIRAFAGGRLTAAPAELLAAFAIAALFGLSDEFHQSFVPGRESSGWDVLADALGAAAAALGCWLWRIRTVPKPSV